MGPSYLHGRNVKLQESRGWRGQEKERRLQGQHWPVTRPRPPLRPSPRSAATYKPSRCHHPLRRPSGALQLNYQQSSPATCQQSFPRPQRRAATDPWATQKEPTKPPPTGDPITSSTQSSFSQPPPPVEARGNMLGGGGGSRVISRQAKPLTEVADRVGKGRVTFSTVRSIPGRRWGLRGGGAAFTERFSSTQSYFSCAPVLSFPHPQQALPQTCFLGTGQCKPLGCKRSSSPPSSAHLLLPPPALWRLEKWHQSPLQPCREVPLTKGGVFKSPPKKAQI